MKNLSHMTSEEASKLEGLLFDLDDTLLEEGQLSLDAYRALFQLKAAGLRLIALTGRPSAWAEVIARMWPVEAAIAENGALAFKRELGRLRTLDTVSPEVRTARQGALGRLVAEARLALPSLVPADDVAGRVSDYTFDIGEHECPSEQLIKDAQGFAESRGARTTRSSVHLHFTFDRVDKATGALSYLQAAGLDATLARQRFAFIGDSENDAPCFSGFAVSVGVANLRGGFSLKPRYRTEGRASAGFREFAAKLLELRQVRS